MRIVALDLQDTKSYEKGHVEFTDGVNAIVGHNGAGKSTILEAIGFALFDCLTGYRQSDFVREGAKSAEIIVTIVSGLDDRSYQVIRRCGSSNSHSIHDPELGTKICDGKADVLTFLRQHMGVEPTADLARLFSDAVGVPQGTFTAAFLQTPAQRKVVFDPLLQVEEYKQAFDRLLEPVRTLQQQQHELDVEMAGFAARVESVPHLQESIAKRAPILTQLQKALTDLDATIETVSAERATLDAAERQITTLRGEQQQVEQQAAALASQLQGAEKAQADAERASATVAQYQADHDAYLAAEEKQKALETRNRERQQLERNQNELDRTVSLKRAELTRLQTESTHIAAAVQTVVALADAVAKQEETEQALQSAQQEESRLQDAQRQLQTLAARETTLSGRLETLQTQLRKAATLEQERTAAEQQLNTLQTELDGNRESLIRYKTEADSLKEQSDALDSVETALCPVCEQPLTAEHRQELQRRNNARLEELRSLYREQQQAIKKAEEQQKATQSTVKTAQEQLRKLPRESEVTELQSEVQAAQEAVQTQQQQVAAFESAPAKVMQLAETLKALGNPREQRAVAAATAARQPDVQNQIRQAEEAIATAQEAVDSVHSALATYATLDDELEQVATARNAALNGYQMVLRHQQVASTLPQRREEVQAIQLAHQTATAAVTNAKQAVAEAEAEFQTERYQAVLVQEQTLRVQRQANQTELALLTREQEREEDELAERLEQQRTLEKLQERHQRVTAQRETLEALRGVLRQAGPYITKALIRQISDGAAQVFSDIMQDYSRHLQWSEDYGISLEVDGRERQFAQLSGGEQMSAALSVRLALLREMSNIDVAFFDEPTTNLDEERRDALARQIIDVKGFRQLFLISHDDTFEQATQNLIRIERVNGLSQVQQSQI